MDNGFKVAEFQRDGKTRYAVVDREGYLMGTKYPGQLAPLPHIYFSEVTAKIVARQLNRDCRGQEGTSEETNMKCDHCGHEWITIVPVGTTRLMCPECDRLTRVDPLTLDAATWESLTRGLVDYPEPDQTPGAAD